VSAISQEYPVRDSLNVQLPRTGFLGLLLPGSRSCESVVLATPVDRLRGDALLVMKPSGRHTSPRLKGRFGDFAGASRNPQMVPSRQGRKVGAIEEHRTIESQEKHSR